MEPVVLHLNWIYFSHVKWNKSVCNLVLDVKVHHSMYAVTDSICIIFRDIAISVMWLGEFSPLLIHFAIIDVLILYTDDLTFTLWLMFGSKDFVLFCASGHIFGFVLNVLYGFILNVLYSFVLKVLYVQKWKQ